MPIQRRLPKRGFTNHFRKEYHAINVGLLDARFENGDTVDTASLVAHGLMSRKYDRVKVLGSGELTKKLTVTVDGVSKSAREKIEAAGGTATVDAPRKWTREIGKSKNKSTKKQNETAGEAD